MELGHRRTEQSILEPGEHLVADELYNGIPPLRAPPLFIMREPNTASASPAINGASSSGSDSGAYWPSPWTSATKSNPLSMA